MKSPEEIKQLFLDGIEYHRKGDLRRAEMQYRQVLNYEPEHADAIHFLGLIAHQSGNHETAVKLMDYSIQIAPHVPVYYNNIGPVLRSRKEFDRSVASFQEAIRLKPDYKEAHNNLGNVLRDMAKLQEAMDEFHKAIAIDPNYAEALNNLGTVQMQLAQRDEALRSFKRAEALGLSAGELFNNIGLLLRQMNRLDEAIAYWRKAIAKSPTLADAHNNLGVALGSQGRLFEAIQSHERAVRLNPEFFQGFMNLGMAYGEQGRFEQAMEVWQKASAINPNAAEPYNKMGIVFQKMKRKDDSIAAFRKAIELEPNLPEPYSNLANTLGQSGAVVEARELLQTALRLKPDFPEALCNLAAICGRMNEFDEAVELSNRALQLRPDLPQAYQNRATAYMGKNLIAEAFADIEEMLRLQPDSAEGHATLGNLQVKLGKNTEALLSFQKCVQLNDDYAEGHACLATLLSKQGKFADAIQSFKRATELNPAIPTISNNLANIYVETGRVEEALALYRQVLHEQYDLSERHSNYVFTCLYSEKITSEQIFHEHRNWAIRYETPFLAGQPRFENQDRSNGRRLRIGYISPDFKDHAVSYFSSPLLENHDATEFDVTCYMDLTTPDAVTERLRSYGHTWVDITGLSHAEVTERLRADQIDIAVDLAGHTGGNRLPALARRVAPIQLSAIGYPCTTGLHSIDYILADHFTDPIGMTERLNSEKLLRLPEVFWCFRPPDFGPDVKVLPADHNGFITFGCYNNFAKVTTKAIQVWCAIMRRVPHSRLQLKARGLGDADTAARLIAAFKEGGISEDRLTLYGWTDLVGFMHQTNEIDIALDTFPFNGGTTSCQTLWQGAPVVTLTGDSRVSRMGVSIMNAIGLPEVIASTTEEYVEIACNLASDLPRLRELRTGMRDRLRASPLLDGPRWTRNLENAYRAIWNTWLAKG